MVETSDAVTERPVWHALEGEEALRRLESRPEGLTAAEASERLRTDGPNIIVVGRRVGPIRIFLEQFKNLLVLILLGADLVTGLVGFFFGYPIYRIDFYVIAGILIFNAVMGMVQRLMADRTAEALKRLLPSRARVRREGRVTEIAAAELVRGDVVLLGQGDRVPADIRLLRAERLSIDESALTGESRPVKKTVETLPVETPLPDRRNIAHLDTFVAGGVGEGVVVATGAQTEVGRILQTMVRLRRPVSPFDREIQEASRQIALGASAVILLAALALLLIYHAPLLQVFLVVVSLAVGAIPEGLPAAVTFALSVGARRLARANVLVKELSTIESLGNVDNICTDKTGTLTQNRMAVAGIYAGGAEARPDGPLARELARAAVLASDATLDEKGEARGEPLEVALLHWAGEIGVDVAELRRTEVRRGEIPFDPATRVMLSRNMGNSGVTDYLKGAPEEVIARSSRELGPEGERELDEEGRRRLLAAVEGLSREGYRVIAVARRPVAAETAELALGENFIFLGLVGTEDPLRPGVEEALATAREAGITVRMLTGDHPATAATVARRLGLLGPEAEVVQGTALESLPEGDRDRLIASSQVFARVEPLHKLLITETLRKLGGSVATTGDGVNDAPALKAADVGIAMGYSGTDLAKEAAKVVLLDDRFATIVEGIRLGRGIFANIRKFVNYILSANLTNVIFVGFAALTGYLAVTPLQLLWVNMNLFPALALAVDPIPPGVMKTPPRGRRERLLDPRLTWIVGIIGLKKAVWVLLVFYLSLRLWGYPLAQSVTFTFLVLSYIERIVTLRTEEGVSFFENSWLTASLLLAFLLQLLILYTPLGVLFSARPLGLWQWLLMLFAVVTGILTARILTAWIVRFTESDYYRTIYGRPAGG